MAILIPPNPSAFLPPLVPPPPPTTLSALLLRLQELFAPQRVVVILGDAGQDAVANLNGLDGYETDYARGWLGRVVSLGTRQLSKSGDEGEEWDSIVELSSSLVSALSGDGGIGQTTTSFVLPSIPLPLHIRSTTLLSDSTGHRTWGSAPLLARLLATTPSTFFPSTLAHPSPLQILELGSGTGLVGFTAAAVLASFAPPRPASLTLTDFDPTTLSNLAFNLALNSALFSSLAINIAPLDWSTYYATRADPPRAEAERFDTILAADVIFEPSHLPWIHATVSALLRHPNSSSYDPTFHLILPLRKTHVVEHLACDRAFDREVEGETSVDEEGRKWRLVTRERRSVRGEDGFRSRGGRKEEGEYWVFDIGWERVL